MSTRLLVAAVALAVLPPASAAPGGQVVRVEHYDPSTTPARGPTNALVTVELFFAPSVMGATRLPAYRQLEALQQRHPTRVRIIYRIVQRNSNPPGPQLPTLALEAYAQGKFFEFITAIHAQRMSMTRDQMLEVGKKVGLDPQRAERAIVDDRYHDVIDANERRLERLRGTTAPMMFFNSKPPRTALQNMSEADYETAYLEAYDRARELLDKGIDRGDLLEAFDAEILHATPPLVITAGPTDDELETESSNHPLADPPLALEGLPSFGKPDALAPVPVVLLCRPDEPGCKDLMRILHRVHNTYRGEIRLVWAPWFEVAREDAAQLTLLGDAALCADRVGSSPDDLDASPGWQWVNEAYTQLSRGRRTTPDKLIDAISAKQHIDTRQLSACRARLASATLDWITAARQSGVTSSPSIVIGGRIYPGLNDANIIQQLVEAELAPGVLGRCATTGC